MVEAKLELSEVKDKLQEAAEDAGCSDYPPTVLLEDVLEAIDKIESDLEAAFESFRRFDEQHQG